MRRFAGAFVALVVSLCAAACDGTPLSTPTYAPLPTDIPTPWMPMLQYAGEGFVIDYLETWIARASDAVGGDVFFGPDGADGPLGMTVRPLGETQQGPDRLLDAYRNHILASVPDASYSDDRADAPNGGRSDFYQDWRAEPRLQYRVTFYVQGGKAYRVIQWSPVADWDRLWFLAFENMLKGFAVSDPE